MYRFLFLLHATQTSVDARLIMTLIFVDQVLIKTNLMPVEASKSETLMIYDLYGTFCKGQFKKAGAATKTKVRSLLPISGHSLFSPYYTFYLSELI